MSDFVALLGTKGGPAIRKGPSSGGALGRRPRISVRTGCASRCKVLTGVQAATLPDFGPI